MNKWKTILTISVLWMISLQTLASAPKNHCYEKIVNFVNYNAMEIRLSSEKAQEGAKQKNSIKALYNQAILNSGSLLDKLHFYILNDNLKEEDKLQVNALYIAMVDEGYICARLDKNKNYNFANIVQEIKELLKV